MNHSSSLPIPQRCAHCTFLLYCCWSNRGGTALHIAVSNGRTECVEFLLQAGADKVGVINNDNWDLTRSNYLYIPQEILDADGKTALQLAELNANKQMSNLLHPDRAVISPFHPF